MKIRNGFVTNSSSTCYLFDLRDPRVLFASERQALVGVTEEVYPDASRIYDAALDYARAESEDEKFDLDRYDNYLATHPIPTCTHPIDSATGDLGRGTAMDIGKRVYRIPECVGVPENVLEEIGIDNALFVRESDEEMGGSLCEEFHDLIAAGVCLAAWEYN